MRVLSEKEADALLNELGSLEHRLHKLRGTFGRNAALKQEKPSPVALTTADDEQLLHAMQRAMSNQGLEHQQPENLNADDCRVENTNADSGREM